MSTFYETPHGGGDLRGPTGDPPIGRPLPGTTVCVVDDGLGPVAEGVTGELLIGGAGLARGYLGDAALTAARFVDVAGRGRMYRTGDLVRRLPGGDLHYVGRTDDQVKIRGFRVEPGEVEAALSRHPGVAAAAVVAREDPPADRQLVAYTVARAGQPTTADGLRRYLAARLPDHMVPAAFVLLDALPSTVNGKLDRAALPAPGRSEAAPGGDRSPGEERMAAIWGRVLGIDARRLGGDDDFFAVGGHSLAATRVVAAVREEFGTETPLRAIFETPTLAALAAVVEGEGASSPASAPLRPRPAPPGAPVPLSLAQEQMWTLEARADPPGLYNFTAIRRFGGRLEQAALRAAVAHLVERHEILRTGVTVEAGRPRQFVAPAAEAEIAFSDVGEADLQARIAAHEARPFDLSRAPLFRVGVFCLGAGDVRVAVTFDHLVNDGTGASVFMAELAAAYGATVAGRPPSLPPLDVQFADFAAWQRAHVTEAVLERQVAWWVEALRGVPPGAAVPPDHLPGTPTNRIASQPVTVDAPTRCALERLARATGGTVFTVATAAAAAVFGRTGGVADVVLSTTVSGRTRAELDGLVGMFSGMGRIRVDLAGDPPFTDLVARANEWMLGTAENQDVPFLRVRRAVQPDFPGTGRTVAAALPIELQYFQSHLDQEFFFRGQLHPLSLTLLDDGTSIVGELSYKLDFYEPATAARLARDLEAVVRAVAADPAVRLSALPVTPPSRRRRSGRARRRSGARRRP
jgi:acyl carrier protein